ncbi:TlpA family protein disulfide reductase [Porphyromonadaceae bacterium OttesenSCG-928-L07]|nr:TlpA family protein disulfide reductase [Porphyromonadaceae bacterium OttesenSCG-928-L07]MDL2252193.1 TlpA family protein disulfide reductase [Odoribacter sp. OttesenSCG-928-J03]
MKNFIFCLFLACTTVASAQSTGEDSGTMVKIGDIVPDFTVDMFDGTHIDIKETRGKVVLLNFWATWCPPCRQELAQVQKKIIDRFQGRDFIFLPISRQDSYDKIKQFRMQTGHTFPMGMDPNRKIYSKFATQTIPRNFLIDKEGRIILSESGYTEEEFQLLIDKIEELLKKD